MNYFKILHTILYWVQSKTNDEDEHNDKAVVARYCNDIIQNKSDVTKDEISLFNMIVDNYIGNKFTDFDENGDYIYDDEEFPKSQYLS